MASYNVSLYKNTGFDINNIPDSPTRLPSPYKTLTGTWDLQNFFLETLKLKIKWDEIKNADYLRIGETGGQQAYYFITGITMVNENNAKVRLQLDALTSMGGPSALSYTGGIITRAHAKSDEMFSNVLDEPIGCSEVLKLSDIGNTSPEGYVEIDNTIIISSADLTNTDISVEGGVITTGRTISFENYDQEVTLTIPQCPSTAVSSTISMTVGGSTYEYNTDVVGYYSRLGNSEILDTNLKYLRSLGLESAVLGCYALPGEYLEYGAPLIDSTTGHVSSLSSVQRNISASESYNYDYPTVQNNKTYMMYNTYLIRSNLSGDIKSFKIEDICQTSEGILNAPQFSVIGDPQYKGRPYCFPKYYMLEEIKNPTYQSVSGLEWYEVPLAYTEASGKTWTYKNYALNYGGDNYDFTKQTRGLITSPFKGLMSTFKEFGDILEDDLSPLLSNADTGNKYLNLIPQYIGNRTKMAGQIYETMATSLGGYKRSDAEVELAYKQVKNILDLRSQTVVAPELSSTPAVGLQRFLPNNFEIYHVRPTNKDIENIDKYFTWYGYAQPNIKFDKKYFVGRTNFNYIECSGVHIVNAENYGLGVKSLAEEQLAGGVRIWHRTPDMNITSNPIAS